MVAANWHEVATGVDASAVLATVVAARIGELAQPCAVVDPLTTVTSVDEKFRLDSDLRAVVMTRYDGPVLIERSWFEVFISGRLGYGRLLHGKRAIADLPIPGPLVFDERTPIAEVAAAVIDRREPGAVSNGVVVAREDGRFDVAAVATIFENLAAHYAHQSLHDPLTGLPNRAYLMARLGELRRRSVPAVLIYVDLDRFKDVNDQHGHAAGDQLLVQFASRLRAGSRASDLVVRLGGDEFAILSADDMSPGHSHAVAERLVLEAAAPFIVTGSDADGTPVEQEVRIGASVGIAHSDRSVPDTRVLALDVLLKQADLALYRAKARGRGRVEHFDDGLVPSRQRTAETRVHRSLERRLRTAIEEQTLSLHFQPVVAFPHGEVVGAEALARWHDTELGSVPPDQFIPVAERTGLILDLGRWVLGAACREAASWPSGPDGAGPTVSVNMSPIQIAEPSIVDEVARALRASGLPPQRLCLEITETAAIADMRETAVRLAQLGALGVRIALDDFGTGFSSLTMLRDLPVHVVKIDRSFVQGITSSAADAVLARLVIDAAHSMGLAVCAEGIEDAAQADQLIALGCDLAQGWFFGMPEPPSSRLRATLAGAGPNLLLADKPPGQARPLMHGSEELVLVTTPDHLISYASATCVALLGWLPHELVGTSLLDHLHPDAPVLGLDTWAGELAAGDVGTYRLRHRDGSYRWFSATSRLVNELGGAAGGILTISRDVTATVEARQALEHSHERFQAAFDQAPIGMTLTDLRGRFLRVNEAFAAMLGTKREACVGLFVADVTHPEDLHTDQDNLAALMLGEENHHVVPKRYLHSDGSVIPVHVWAARVGSPTDPDPYVIAHVLPAGPAAPVPTGVVPTAVPSP